MSQSTKQLEEQIESLKLKADQKKKLLMLREQKAKREQKQKERQNRNRHIYKIGGIVDKMGLADIDETVLLGLLYNAHKILDKKDPQMMQQLIDWGEDYQEKGKRLPPPE